MAERISALHEHTTRGRFGAPGEVGVVLREVRGLVLHQIAAWPGNIHKVAQAVGVSAAPGPGQATIAADGSALLRVEPLKWWLLGEPAPHINPEHGTTLDLSHSRTRLRITGEHAATLLSRHLPLDLREASFPAGSVASTSLHHTGVTLWRSAHGYELFIPRGVALSLWEVLLKTAAQFGGEVV